MLTHILPNQLKNDRVMNWAEYGKIIEFDQEGPRSMDPKGFVYVPDTCVNGGCHLHVAFHGCSQSVSYLNEDYIQNTGYLEWAAANDLIVLFPQTIKTKVNENGCWDFWGYTGNTYATKDGEQPKAIMDMVHKL